MTLETKQNVSKFFNTNWTITPIEWKGLPFSIVGKDEWIKVEYIPSGNSSLDISNDGYRQSSYISVFIHARKENRCYELYDILCTKLQTVKIDNVKVRYIDVNNKSNLDTTNGVYTFMEVGVTIKTL